MSITLNTSVFLPSLINTDTYASTRHPQRRQVVPKHGILDFVRAHSLPATDAEPGLSLWSISALLYLY